MRSIGAMSDKTHIAIRIPYDLAAFATCQRKLVNKYETNQVIKALDTWLVLKHETCSSYIQQWNKQKQWLLSICKVSESIFRHRLRILQDLQLLKYDRNAIQVCSWEKLAARLSIDTNKCLTVNYCIDDKQRLQEWIIATEIEDNQHRQEYALLTKLNKNPDTYNAIFAAMIAAGADRNRLKNASYFLSYMRMLYQSSFIWGSEIHEELIQFRPDNNRGVRGMANAWCCKSPVTVSYWKKRMQESKIIDVAALQLESRKRARNRFCKVLWLQSSKQTLLCLCDQITILKPWLIQGEFLPAA